MSRPGPIPLHLLRYLECSMKAGMRNACGEGGREKGRVE